MKIQTKIMAVLAMLTLLAAPASARESDFTNHIGMKFKTIPAGSFFMGSCMPLTKKQKFLGLSLRDVCPSGAGADNDAEDYETPQHKVTITKSFQMGVYEVTLGQFKKFIGAAERDDLISRDFMKANRHGNDAAVNYVTWKAAKAFLDWLNSTKPASDKGTYRLPTEAEWEYAARAGSNTRYSWGDSKNQAGAHAWYIKNSHSAGEKYAHSVGQKKPNHWGLYDMHGNVWEWVHDYWKSKYSRKTQADPKGPKSGSYRVLRGGGWTNGADRLRSALRTYRSPSDRHDYLGFRLVRQP